jgi:hypothetical protein
MIWDWTLNERERNMAIKRSWLMTFLIILPLALVVSCSEFGKVDQGRVVKFDKEKWTATIIRDVKHDAKNPDYNHLPPITYALPKNPMEMGEEPKAGGRMKLDTKNKQLVIFDPSAQNFKTIDYTLIDEKDDIGRDDPLVYDKAEKKAKKFPVVDKEKKTISIYSGRQKILVTFSLPEEYFSLPDSTWDAGDEIRIYYHEEGKAQRCMNVTRTDIFR